jgi:hypothetical protein
MERCLLNTGVYFRDGGGAECCDGSGTGGSPSASSSVGASLRAVGGAYPFGEVISESLILSDLSGTCDIFAYPNLHRTVTSCVLDVDRAADAAALSLTHTTPVDDSVGAGDATTAAAKTSDDCATAARNDDMTIASRPAAADGGIAGPFRVTIERGVLVDVASDAPQSFRDLLAMVRSVEDGKVIVRELGIGLNPHIGRGLGNTLGDVTAFERQRGVHLSLGKRHPLFPKNRSATQYEEILALRRRAAKGGSNSVIGSNTAEAEANPMVDVEHKLEPHDMLKRKDGRMHLDVFIDVAAIEVEDATGLVANSSARVENIVEY